MAVNLTQTALQSLELPVLPTPRCLLLKSLIHEINQGILFHLHLFLIQSGERIHMPGIGNTPLVPAMWSLLPTGW